MFTIINDQKICSKTKMLVNSKQSNEHITLKTGKKKTFSTERSSQSSILPNHKPFTQPKENQNHHGLLEGRWR